MRRVSISHPQTSKTSAYVTKFLHLDAADLGTNMALALNSGYMIWRFPGHDREALTFGTAEFITQKSKIIN